jgi:hypothetical protein
MEESKMASAIAEGIVRGQAQLMEKFVGVLRETAEKSGQPFGFYVEVKSEELGRMLRDRAAELRADVARMRPIVQKLASANAEMREFGGRRLGGGGLLDEQTAGERLDEVEKDASRLDFLSTHLVEKASYRLTLHDLSSALLEGHQGLAALRCYTGAR